MVYIQSQEITQDEFKSLLEKTRVLCLEKIKKTPTQKMDGVSFEFFVFEEMCSAAKNTKFEGFITQTGKQTFPDIIANKYFFFSSIAETNSISFSRLCFLPFA